MYWLTSVMNRLGDIINKWRHTLDLEPITARIGPVLVEHLKVPFTYNWSPAFGPKPVDWGKHIGMLTYSALSITLLTPYRCLRFLFPRPTDL
jgi:hypothetical protein